MSKSHGWWHTGSSGYLVAVVATALAVVVRWLLHPWLDDDLAVIPLFVAVAVAVWFGGSGPALLAAGLGYLAGDYLFAPPDSGFGFGLLAYLFTCAIIIGLGQVSRGAWTRLARQRESLRITLASIGDAVITTDHNARITQLNSVAEALTGWSQEEAIGQSVDAVFHIVDEHTRRIVACPATRALREGRAVGLANHTVLLAKNGREHQIDDTAAPIRDELGEIVGSVLIFRDVSERRLAQIAVEKSERDLNDFFDNAVVALHWVGPDGRIQRANQAELDLLGYAREEYVGRDIAEFYVDPERIEQTLARLLRGESVHEEPADLRCKDGSIKHVLISSSGLFEDGRFVRTRCFTVDVTERKRAAETQSLLAAIVEASTDAIVSKTLEGQILSWNAGAERLFGYAADEAVGQSIDLIIPPDRRDEEREILRRLGDGERIEHFETARVAKDGRRVHISLTISPVRDEAGRIIGASKVARDVSDRKRADAALRASEKRYRALVESGAEMVCRFRPDGTIQFANSAFARVRGTTSDALEGSSFWEFIPPEDRPGVQEMLRRMTPEHPEARIENRFETVDGPRWFLWTNRALCFDASGGVIEAQCVGVDITEHKRAEEALRVSEERFRMTANAAPVMIWMSGTDRQYVWFNQPWLRFVGRALEEEIGRGWLENVHRDDAGACMETYSSAFDRHESFQMEYRLRRHDGEYRWLLDHGAPLIGPEGTFMGYIGSCVDITDRKRVEENLRESETRFRTIADSAPVLMWLNDASGYTFVNRAYLAFLGLTDQEEVRGYGWMKYVHPDDREPCRSEFAAAVERHAAFRTEFRFRRHDGEFRWMQSIGSARFTAGGDYLGYTGCTYDIHDARQAAAALREVDRRKDEFLATLAHELRNPLAPIGNAVEVLKQKEDDRGLLRQARDTIQRQLTYMVRLVDDLLDVSRITRDRLELRKSRVELASVVDHAIELWRPFAELSGQEFAIAMPAEPVLLDADPIRLAQVLSNLLNNASKYTPRGGSIKITAGQQKDEIVIAVRDNGIGIAPDKLESIFDMFAQADSTLERSRGGLGIGLTLARRLIELHGGRISAHSEGLGHGSEFTIHLPVRAGLKHTISAPAPVSGTRTTSRRILVVDDNDDSARSLALLLKVAGHETEMAFDGLAAIEAVQRFRPEVVLLDIGLPKLDGLEVCRRIRAQPWGSGLVIVAVSGWGQKDDLRQSEEAGFDSHLVKPVSYAALRRLLEDLAAEA